MILKEKGQTMMKNSRALIFIRVHPPNVIYSLSFNLTSFHTTFAARFSARKKLKRNHQSKSRAADEFSIQKTTKGAQRKKRKCG
jgi:hypothetical protein